MCVGEVQPLAPVTPLRFKSGPDLGDGAWLTAIIWLGPRPPPAKFGPDF